MPTLSVWAVRASLLHLALGFTFGGLMLFNKGVPLHPMIWALLPTHIEVLLFGWVAQLAMAVGFWILPRFSGQRGNVQLAWVAILLLNAGTIMAGFGPFFPSGEVLLLIGRALMVAAVGAFAFHAWPRVKPPGALRPSD